MSCPTCGHTMHLFLSDGDEKSYWCPRCGTILTPLFTSPAGEVPNLVETCRNLLRSCDSAVLPDSWTRALAEAVVPPGESLNARSRRLENGKIFPQLLLTVLAGLG